MRVRLNKINLLKSNIHIILYYVLKNITIFNFCEEFLDSISTEILVEL